MRTYATPIYSPKPEAFVEVYGYLAGVPPGFWKGLRVQAHNQGCVRVRVLCMEPSGSLSYLWWGDDDALARNPKP